MSEYLKAFLLSKKNNKSHKVIPKSKYKPAEKNINFTYIDSITYNLIESMTMFKNKEITKNELNVFLLSNLSLILCKGDIDKKELEKLKKDTITDNKKCSIDNYGIYFPTTRVTCLDSTNNNKNDNDIKIPCVYENIRTFYPSGRNFLNIKIKDDCDMTSNIIKNNSSFQESNDNDNSLSLVSEESLVSNKDIINGSNKELYDSSNRKVFRNLKKFKKYKQLVDFIECPLTKEETSKEKYNNFIKLLNNVDDFLENNDNDINIINNINENIYLNEEINIINYNYKKVYMDDFEIINSFNIIEQMKNKNISSIIYEDKKNKSANLTKIINSDLLLNSTLKNDLNETMDKTTNSKNDIKLLNNKNDKSLEISTSLRKKYLKKMNDTYISLIHKVYIDFRTKCLLAKNIYLDDIMIKKFFIQLFKKFLLNVGVHNKKIYEKILKTQIFSNKLLTFDQFIQCFDTIIYDNENENLMVKFLFLFNILPHLNDDDFLNSKKIELFFDMLGCGPIYIQDFCEMLGERLVMRFNAVYKNYEEENILRGKYRFKKMKIILESFFDSLQIED